MGTDLCKSLLLPLYKVKIEAVRPKSSNISISLKFLYLKHICRLEESFLFLSTRFWTLNCKTIEENRKENVLTHRQASGFPHDRFYDLGKENIVDKYWKRGEKTKEDEQINEEDSSPNLKYKGMKDDEVKKYVSCKDEENGSVCTAEDGTKHEVDSYWRFKTKKEKEEESSGTIITPIIPSIVVH